VSALNVGVQQFKQQFGFLPPLVVADQITPKVYVQTSGGLTWPQVWTTSQLSDPTNSAPNMDQLPGSQQSIAYYLYGALDKDIDGVDGPGFTAPSTSQDGSFTNRGKRYDAFFDPLKFKTKRGIPRMYRESAGIASPSLAQSLNCGVLSYWSNLPGGGQLS